MSFESQKSVKSLIYLIETSDYKKPPERTLGGRYLTNGTISGIYDQTSISKTDGHINRNIRLMTALLEMIDPKIEIIGYQRSPEAVIFFWKVNGCTTSIDEIQHIYMGKEYNFYKHQLNEKWNCFLHGDASSSDGAILTAVFMTYIEFNDDLIVHLKAKVDHDLTIMPRERAGSTDKLLPYLEP